MTLLCLNFLTLTLASYFERARAPCHKVWLEQAAQQKGESHHERIQYGI